MDFATRFKFGDKVLLDGDSSLVAVVTGFTFRRGYSQVEIAWVHNGCCNSQWIEDWRLSAAEARQ